MGTAASEAVRLGLTEVLFDLVVWSGFFGLDGLTVHACCATAWRLELRTCSFLVDGNICWPSARFPLISLLSLAVCT